MRICLASREYPPETVGGIGTQTFLKAHALARLGHTVHVLTSTYTGSPGTAHEGEVTVHRIADPSVAEPFSEPSLQWLSYSRAVAARLYELLDEDGLDLVEFPEYGAEGFAFELDRGHLDVRVAVMLHGSLLMFGERLGWPERDSPFHRVGGFMEETVVGGADLVLAASENVAGFWAERGVEDIRVVHTAVDTELFAPAESRGNLVLFVGRIDEAKGVFAVAEAVAAIEGARCRIIGTGETEDLTALDRLTARSDAAERFELLDHVPHDLLPRHYAECDVFAAPAPGDHGLSTVYLEAMASGKPVIASTAGGAGEAVVDGETGILVPPGDAAALEGALRQLLGDGSLRRRLGEAGRQRAVTEFSAERLAARVLEAYEEVMPATVGAG